MYGNKYHQLFRSVIKGRNIMTPQFVRYAETLNYIIELSTGTGFEGEPIYGVTVVNKHTGQHEFELSDMFYSREFAEAYIADLK